MSYVGTNRKPLKHRLYEHKTSFSKPKINSPTICTNLPTTYGNCMKKDEKYTMKWKKLDKSTANSNQTLLYVLILQPGKTIHSKC